MKLWEEKKRREKKKEREEEERRERSSEKTGGELWKCFDASSGASREASGGLPSIVRGREGGAFKRKGREENEGAAPLFPCVFASIQRRGDHVRTRATLEQNKELKEQTSFFDLSSQEAF